ncbi:stage V sporulation protein D, partial [candidate division KSB1 bacterium]|nr:stage V sporulation protein D [candidate division KSB1 bacterium]
MAHGYEIKRISFLLTLALLVWIILILRMAQLQLIDRGKYVEKAKSQYIMETKIASNRGTIYDRNAEYLAVNRPALSVGVDIKKVQDPNYAASKFAEILGGNQSYYLRQLTNGNHFIWLRRGIDDEIAPQFDTLNIDGVQVINEMKRYYPHTKLAANLVGFTDVDLKGLSGIELTQDKLLQGNPGRAFYQKDALGKTFAGMSKSVEKPQSGKNVILTIDNTYQLFAEEELKYTINEHNADGGIVVVTNPRTGEVLAMAVSPSFDPNAPGNYPPGSWRNRSITDSFEPGSTFKPIFMSAILEEDIKTPEDIIYCESGKYKIFDREIEDVSGYGWLTLR